MKKLLLLFLLSARLLTAQSLCNQRTCMPFANNDLYQVYSRIVTVSGVTLSPCSYTTCSPFYNTDLYQIYGAIGTLTASGGGSSAAWTYTGNAISTNTNFLGTTTNRSLLFYTDNAQRFKIDSLGKGYYGTAVTNTATNGIFRVNQTGGITDIGSVFGTVPAIHMGLSSNTDNNFTLAGTGVRTILNSPSTSGEITMGHGNSINALYLRGQSSGTGLPGFYTERSNRTNCGNFNLPDFNYVSATTSYSTTTNLTETDNHYFFGQTIACSAGNKNVINAVNHYVAGPVAGTSVTIINPWSIKTEKGIWNFGKLRFDGTGLNTMDLRYDATDFAFEGANNLIFRPNNVESFVFTPTRAISYFNLSFPIAGAGLVVKEGTGGRLGTTTLVAGTKTITISGLTTSSRAFVQLVTPGGTLGANFKAVCTANTLEITSVSADGLTQSLDTSTLNYFIVEGQ